MSRIMSQLSEDHGHVAQLLELLDTELAKVGAGASAEYALMEDAMRYMTGYSDRFHHPREDLVYERLRARAPEMKTVLEGLLREHATLAQMGNAFTEVLGQVVDGGLADREAMYQQGREYVEMLRAHMTTEDREVFPQALRSLDAADWARVDGAMQVQEDPLFGRIVHDDFIDLYHYVMRESA